MAFHHQQWETSVSRAYYAAFHLMILLLEEKAGIVRKRWDHIELQKEFRHLFCEKGYLFDMQDARDLANLLDERIAADYYEVELNAPRVRRTLERAERLCQKVKEVLSHA